MLKSVLVPLDQSPLAELAVPVAGEIARRNAAVMHLVLSHRPVDHVLGMGQPVAMRGHEDADAQLERSAYLQSVATRISRETGVSVQWRVLQGPPAFAIDRYVRDHAIDLVVMTTHGRGGLARAWLGSTTDALLRTTSVPLLLLRGTTNASSGRFSRVVAALDGSATAERALAMAARLREGGHCTLLHVITPRLAYPSHYVPEPEEQKATARAYLDCVGGRVRRDWQTIKTRAEVGADVAETILSQAGEVAANLLVLGTHARTPVMRAFVGSVADKVIRGTDIAVLVAPPGTTADAITG